MAGLTQDQGAVIAGSAFAGGLGGTLFGGPIGMILGFIGGAIAGFIAVGEMQEADAEAERLRLEAERQRIEAENLKELSEAGGYYDQVLEAIQTELDDIEADRAAAATNLSMTLSELEGQVGVSKLQESAAVAGQVVQGLETARTGAEAEGQVRAAAGAGGVSVGSGSVLRTAASIGRAISRRVAVTNLGISATRMQGEMERSIIRNNMVRAQMNYEDVIRGQDTREAQTLAHETLTEFQQESGTEQAEWMSSLAEWMSSQADWMQGPGMGFTALSGILNAASTGVGLGSRFDTPSPGGTTPSGNYNFTSGGAGYGYGPTSANPISWSMTGSGGGVRTEFDTGGSY